jgi:Fic family protein
MLGAKYCKGFVMTRPFVDGNGRMCRLIPNAILLGYAGVVLALGEQDGSRNEYLDLQRNIQKKATAKYRAIK